MQDFLTLPSYCKQSLMEVVDVMVAAAHENQVLAVEVSDGSGFARNALVWPATPEGLIAANDYARNLFSRWFAAKEYRIGAFDPREHDSMQEVD